ncbi:hypothetical protein [Maribacter sp. 2304DJ31-5]|uniref:hypothetical protein n=1 Tax=Maribacter sp. 2304DJ31-5 TaxID=3386273 RepID=UPI0039BC314E
MKLTQDHIEQLYKFTRAHYVEHYDLQTELVDHLANGIEAQWQEDPGISFTEAMHKEFRKFGITGFNDIIQERRSAMAVRYYKVVLRFYKEYFRLPKVVLTLTSIFILTVIFWAIPIPYRYWVFIGSLFLITGTLICYIFISGKNKGPKQVKEERKWMLEDQIYRLGNIVQIVNVFPMVFSNKYFWDIIDMTDFYMLLSCASLIVCLLLFGYVTLKIIPAKAEELLAETYPEYKMN